MSAIRLPISCLLLAPFIRQELGSSQQCPASIPWQRGRTLDGAVLDVVANRLGAPSVHLAANAEGGPQNLQDRALELLGEGLEAHLTRDVDDLIQRY